MAPAAVAPDITLHSTLASAGGSGYGAPGFEMSQWGYNTVANQGIAAGAVPAPGALALLGVAGLAGARRRRA